MSPFAIALFLAVVLFLVVPTVVHGRSRRYAASLRNRRQKPAGSRPTPMMGRSKSRARPTTDAGNDWFGPAAPAPVSNQDWSLDHSPFAENKLHDLTRPLDNKREEMRTLDLFKLDKKNDLTRSILDDTDM